MLNAFSAHADRNDLLDYVARTTPRKICLVHGETKQRAALAARLRTAQTAEVLEPATGDVLEL